MQIERSTDEKLREFSILLFGAGAAKTNDDTDLGLILSLKRGHWNKNKTNEVINFLQDIYNEIETYSAEDVLKISIWIWETPSLFLFYGTKYWDANPSDREKIERYYADITKLVEKIIYSQNNDEFPHGMAVNSNL